MAFKSVWDSFSEVTYQFDSLRGAGVTEVADAIEELETALINFETSLEYFLEEVHELEAELFNEKEVD